MRSFVKATDVAPDSVQPGTDVFVEDILLEEDDEDSDSECPQGVATLEQFLQQQLTQLQAHIQTQNASNSSQSSKQQQQQQHASQDKGSNMRHASPLNDNSRSSGVCEHHATQLHGAQGHEHGHGHGIKRRLHTKASCQVPLHATPNSSVRHSLCLLMP